MSSAVFELEVQELRRPGSVYSIWVKWFTSIKEIKIKLRKIIKCPLSRMQIYHSSSSKSLSNNTTLHDLGIDKAGFVLRLALIFPTNPKYLLVPSKDISLDEQCESMLRQVRLGLRCGHKPSKTDELDCTGGVYFLKGSSNKPTAVFKPNDEEQGMPNNMKGHSGNGEQGLRPFLKPGEGYIRETASYILDYGNFCNVPPTTIVHCEHDIFHYPRLQNGEKPVFPKLGSLQKFCPAGDTFEDISPSMVSVLELQKIALLDMRLLNCDRNASNILVVRKLIQSTDSTMGPPRKYCRSGSLGCSSGDEMDLDAFLDDKHTTPVDSFADVYDLIPIDHGYCIPSKLRVDELDWAWFYCPHISAPVHPEIVDYMKSLNIEELLADLSKQITLSDDSLFLLRVSHALIVEGIAAGLTLRDIAEIIARTDEKVPSLLETAIAAAEDNAVRMIEMRAARRAAGGGGSSTAGSRSTSPSIVKSLQAAAAVTSAVQYSTSRKMGHEHRGRMHSFNGGTSQEGSVVVTPTRSSLTANGSSSTGESACAVGVELPSPHQVHKKVNSELNLESIGNSPCITSVGNASSNSRIGYLSSENIKKLQENPRINVSRFPEDFPARADSTPYSAISNGDDVPRGLTPTQCAGISLMNDSIRITEEDGTLQVHQEPTYNYNDQISCKRSYNTNDDEYDNYSGYGNDGDDMVMGLPDEDVEETDAVYCEQLDRFDSQNSASSSFQHPGVSLGLNMAASGSGRPGGPLVTMQSLDSSYLIPTPPHTSSQVSHPVQIEARKEELDCREGAESVLFHCKPHQAIAHERNLFTRTLPLSSTTFVSQSQQPSSAWDEEEEHEVVDPLSVKASFQSVRPCRFAPIDQMGSPENTNSSCSGAAAASCSTASARTSLAAFSPPLSAAASTSASPVLPLPSMKNLNNNSNSIRSGDTVVRTGPVQHSQEDDHSNQHTMRTTDCAGAASEGEITSCEACSPHSLGEGFFINSVMRLHPHYIPPQTAFSTVRPIAGTNTATKSRAIATDGAVLLGGGDEQPTEVVPPPHIQQQLQLNVPVATGAMDVCGGDDLTLYSPGAPSAVSTDKDTFSSSSMGRYSALSESNSWNALYPATSPLNSSLNGSSKRCNTGFADRGMAATTYSSDGVVVDPSVTGNLPSCGVTDMGKPAASHHECGEKRSLVGSKRSNKEGNLIAAPRDKELVATTAVEVPSDATTDSEGDEVQQFRSSNASLDLLCSITRAKDNKDSAVSLVMSSNKECSRNHTPTSFLHKQQRLKQQSSAVRLSKMQNCSPSSTIVDHNVPPPVSMQRVASFTAFESPPLYDQSAKSERQLARLRKEKRRVMQRTEEFKELRMGFASESVTSIVSKVSRAKFKAGIRGNTL